MATPSSKQNPGATPTYLTSSPRPSGGNMHRPMSLKSPSTRTPSGSGHGHSQLPAPSSNQYATPTGVTGENDNPISFSSPSALLALGAYGGISPSPAVHDALVGPGMNEGDIQALGMQGLKLGTARDNDEERRRHINGVVQLLWSRVAGRGVCREAVERLGELERFESIWQEDNLSIAGNFVDLEIEFHRGHNVVKDVSLKYATPEATDGERREEATAVLKRDLIQTPEEGERGSWKDLTNFHENLQWLARHDRLSQEVNCFEAIEGLYESLRRVWDEEASQRKFAGDYDHLCSGWVGRPRLHKGGRIGLGLDYWLPRARVLDAKRRKSPDDMAVDQSPENSTDDQLARMDGQWSIMIECEEGYPPLLVSKDWVGSPVFTAVSNTVPDAPSSSEQAGPEVMVVNWADPPVSSGTANQGSSDNMDLDSSMLGSSSVNRRFVARMEPPLDLPILAASEIYRHLGTQMQDFKMLTYDLLLAPGWSPLSAAGSMGLSPEEAAQVGRKRRSVSVQSFDKEGKPCTKRHSYTFQPFESAAGLTMKDIPFSHPRQLADILPILRQYAFLANMIRSTFPPPSKSDESKKGSNQDKPNGVTGQQKSPRVTTKDDGNITILSNENPNENRLNLLLGSDQAEEPTEGKGKNTVKTGDGDFDGASEDELRVDVTLRTQLGQSPMIMLLFTVDQSPPSEPGSATVEFASSNVSISFEVGLNGRVSVVDVTGLLEAEHTNTHAVDEQENRSHQLRSKLAKVVEISQDIGVLVEWVRRWARQQKSRR